MKIFCKLYDEKIILIFISIKKIYSARDGDRTHAHIRELDLKSNALTTRPPGLTIAYNY